MSRWTVSLAAVVGLILVTAPSAALGQSGPAVVSKHALTLADPPSRFRLVQLVQEFEPGSQTPSHSHGGDGQVSVTRGELVVRVDEDEKRYHAGDGFAEKAGATIQVANTSDEPAQMVVTFVLPEGATLTTPRGTSSAPGPKVAAKHERKLTSPGRFALVQLVQDFARGAQTPPHSHGGEGQASVLEGELVLRVAGAESVHRRGQGFAENAGETMQVVNRSETKARMAVAFVLPEGATLTTARAASIGGRNLPHTGPGPIVAIAAAGVWLVGAGLRFCVDARNNASPNVARSAAPGGIGKGRRRKETP